MEIQASRARARTGPAGEPVLLLDQDRSRWDYVLIGRGLAALDRAAKVDGAFGPYALQAAIAACHARARTPDATDWGRIAALHGALSQTAPAAIAACHARARTPDATDWVRIAALYDALSQIAPSPVVEVNRAVAVSMA